MEADINSLRLRQLLQLPTRYPLLSSGLLARPYLSYSLLHLLMLLEVLFVEEVGDSGEVFAVDGSHPQFALPNGSLDLVDKLTLFLHFFQLKFFSFPQPWNLSPSTDSTTTCSEDPFLGLPTSLGLWSGLLHYDFLIPWCQKCDYGLTLLV